MGNEVNGSRAKAGTIEVMGREEFDLREHGVAMVEEELRWDGTRGVFSKIFEKMGRVPAVCEAVGDAGRSHLKLWLMGMWVPQGARLSWRRAIGGDWFVDVFLREGMPAMKLPIFAWHKYPEMYELVFNNQLPGVPGGIHESVDASVADRVPSGIEVGVSGSPDADPYASMQWGNRDADEGGELERRVQDGPRVSIKLDVLLNRNADRLVGLSEGIGAAMILTSSRRLISRYEEWRTEIDKLAESLRKAAVQASGLREDKKQLSSLLEAAMSERDNWKVDSERWEKSYRILESKVMEEKAENPKKSKELGADLAPSLSKILAPYLEEFGVRAWAIYAKDGGYGIYLLKDSYLAGEQPAFLTWLEEQTPNDAKWIRGYNITADAEKWASWGSDKDVFIGGTDSLSHKTVVENMRRTFAEMMADRDGWKKEWELMNEKNREIELDRDHWRKKYDFVKADRENWMKDFDRVSKECIACENARKADMETLELAGLLPEGCLGQPFNQRRHDEQKAAWEDRVAADDARREAKNFEKEVPALAKHCFIARPNVFPFDVLFVFNYERSEISDWLAERGFEGFDDFDKEDSPVFDHMTVNAKTYGHENGPIFVRFKEWSPNKKGLGFLAHEIFHAVEFMMYKLSIPHDVWKTSEVYAYMTQFLMEEAVTQLGITIDADGN